MHRSTAHNYGALTASPSVFEENESCGDFEFSALKKCFREVRVKR